MKFSREEFNKRLATKFLIHPATILPITMGLTLGIVGFAIASGKLIFLGIAGGLLGTAGTLSTRFFVGLESSAKEVMEQMEKEIEQQRNEELDRLYEDLKQDRDKRTQTLLSDLRALTEDYRRKRRSLGDSISAKVSFDLSGKIEELFEASVMNLKESLVLRKKVREISSEKAKKRFRERRNERIEGVERSVEQIGRIITELEERASKDIMTGETDLDRISRELDSELDILRKVEERMSGDADYSEFLEAAEEAGIN